MEQMTQLETGDATEPMPLPTKDAPTSVAVIIPYFQREAGILARAVESVLAQKRPPSVTLRVFIIDDASPVAATTELANLNATAGITLDVVRQSNAGPGGARNHGLEMAERAGDIDFVAFLDSDDIWRPTHLSDALSALTTGYDFYCCDNSRDGIFARFSDDVALLNDGGRALAGHAIALDPEGPVLGFPPHALDDEFVTGYLSHTSTVVLRAAKIHGLRFDPELRNASEDRMFWLTVVLAGAAVVISWRCNVSCGLGVNVFFAAYDWNAPATLERIGCQLLFAEKLIRMPVMTPRRIAFARHRARTTRRAYSFLFLRTLLKGRRPQLHSFRRLLRLDPWLPLRMPALFIAVLVDRTPEARKF
jgi:succinoglycan biosynthesis protein ExoW